MANLELTNDQLRLIQNALDFYSRIGILQLDRILDHPTIDSVIEDRFRPKKELEVGDKTGRGEIVEITKKYIKTKGSWGNGEEIRTWKDIENVKLSTNYTKFHETKDLIRQKMDEINFLISGQNFGRGGSFGIHNESVDESCREAFDIIQAIRHEFWKVDPRKTNVTVDSSVHQTSHAKLPKVEIDTEEYLEFLNKIYAKYK